MEATATVASDTDASGPPPLKPSLVPVATLKGHTDSVNSIVYNENKQNLISGSDDGTARFWDIAAGKSTRCFVPPSPSTSRDPITSVALDPSNEDRFFLSSGAKIFAFDLRRPEIVLRETTVNLDVNSDEVNRICIDKKGRFLASCDDSGEVKIVELQPQRAWRTLRKHTACCYTCKFRPNHQYEILTGAFDCNVIHYDFSKSSPLCIYNVFDVQRGGPQIVNPAYIYDIDISDDGNIMCSALGDGSIDFIHLGIQDRIGRAEMAHASATTQALFPAFGKSKYVVSSGLDQKLNIWEYTIPTEEQVAAHVADQRWIQTELSRRHAKAAKANKAASKAKKKAGKATASTTTAPVAEEEEYGEVITPSVPSPSSLFKIEKIHSRSHPSKINCITTSADGTMWIGDVSSEITVLKFST